MLTTNTDRSPKRMSTRRRHFICVRCAVILRYTDSVGVTILVTCLTLSVNQVWDSPSYLIRDDRFMITKKVPKVQVKQIEIAWQKRHPMLV